MESFRKLLSPSVLRTNFSWSLAGNAVYSACQWGIIVAIAKFGTPELLGQFSLALATTTPIFMLTNLNLSVVQVSDARDQFSFREYLGLRLCTSALALAMVAAIAFWTGWQAGVVLLVLLLGTAKAVESVSDVIYGLWQKHERLDLVAGSLIRRGVFGLALVCLVLWLRLELAAAVAAILLIWFSVLILHDSGRVAALATLKPAFNRTILKRIALLALPLGLVAGLSSLSHELPRYFLEYWHGHRELGLFAAIVSLAAAARLLSLALSRAAAPRLARYFAQGSLDRFRSLLRRLMLVGAGIGVAGLVGAALLGEAVLSFVYDPEYAARTDVLMWAMASAGLVAGGTFVGAALSATRAFRSQLAIHTGKTVLTVAACVVLVPAHGSLGGAWAIFIANFYSIVVYWLVLQRRLGVVPSLSRSPAV